MHRPWVILGPLRFITRLFGCIVVAIALPVGGASAGGRFGVIAGITLSVVGILYLWLWLPRSAHSAFERGKYARAARRYRLLGALATSAARERAALLSRSGCEVAAGNVTAADALLALLDDAKLTPAERAVWLNNRACGRLAANDAPAALTLVDEASSLRPDVPAVQHTRGLALLAVGRVDDAIAVFDSMRAGGELPPHLESERCRDLAKAWTQKGETAYAEDYRLRAEALVR